MRSAGGRLLQFKGRTLLLAAADSSEGDLLSSAQAATRQKAAVKGRRQQARFFGRGCLHGRLVHPNLIINCGRSGGRGGPVANVVAHIHIYLTRRRDSSLRLVRLS